ncbi:MAG: hypothetical protein ACTSO2_13435 [Promethearchaeota archaeon]
MCTRNLSKEKNSTETASIDKKRKHEGWKIFLITMVCIGLADLAKIFLLKDAESFFNQPITNIALMILTIIGLLKNNEFFYGIGIVAILPSFLLAINDIINEDIIFFINVSFVVFGSFIFLKKRITHWWYLLIDAAIYEYFIFLPKFSISQNIIDNFSQFFVTYFTIFIFISSFFMSFFVLMKNIELKVMEEIPTLYANPNKKFENFLDRKIKNPTLRKWIVLILYIMSGLTLGFFKWLFFGGPFVIFTISMWSFVCACFLLFINSSLMSSEIISVAPPIIYVMIFNVKMEMGLFLVILNAIYHAFIVIMAFVSFFKRNGARWDRILVFGLLLKILSYVINYFFPGYIVNLSEFMYFLFLDTIITSILYFFFTVLSKSYKRKKIEIMYMLKRNEIRKIR